MAWPKSKSQTLIDTLELRHGSVINHDEINALKRRWNPHRSARKGINAYAEYELFMQGVPYQVSEASAAIGLAWWQRVCFKKNGELRNTKFLRESSPHAPEFVGSIIADFDHFELIDFEWESNGYYDWPYPVYETFSKAGNAFRFVQRPWVSGGNYIL